MAAVQERTEAVKINEFQQPVMVEERLHMRRIGVWSHLADAVVFERLDTLVIVLQTWVRVPRGTCKSIDFFPGFAWH